MIDFILECYWILFKVCFALSLTFLLLFLFFGTLVVFKEKKRKKERQNSDVVGL